MVDASRFRADEDTPDDLGGRVFGGKYEIVAAIGAGGMGSVWRARHRTIGRDVAIKVMKPGAAGSLNAVKRFYREAKSGSALTHPHTVRVYDFGATDDGLLYLVVELLEGRELRDAQRTEGPLAPLRSVRIARQICQSLDEAHEAGIVHRDLKPSNVFLTEVHRQSDFVKVIDFGISRPVDQGDDTTLTETGAVIGTPRYMAPEQASGRAVDRRSDLYALGIVLYEMLTGTIPFEADSTPALLVAHVSQPPWPLPDSIGGETIPRALRDLVLELLSKQPVDRPATAAAVDERLAAIEAGILGVDPALLGPAPQAAPARPRVIEPDPLGETATAPPSRAAPRSRSWQVAAAALLAGLVGVGLWLAWTPAVRHEAAPATAPGAGLRTNEALHASAPAVPPGAGGDEVPDPPSASAAEDARGAASDETPADARGATSEGAPTDGGPDAARAVIPDATADAPAPQPTRVTLRSSPGRASVLRDGVPVGETPIEVEVSASGAVDLELVRAGYFREAVHVAASDAPVRTVTLRARARARPPRESPAPDDGPPTIRIR